MNLKRLRNFVRIVDAGSITRAAAVIRVAQPALTMQVTQLEEELGARLLVRSARGVQPTQAGLVLYREARLLLRQAEQLPLLVKASTADLHGDVTIGFPTSLAPLLAPALADLMRLRHPKVRLRVTEGDSATLREFVLKGRLDMAVVNAFAASDELARRPLFRQRLALLVEAMAGDAIGPVPLAQALREALCLPGRGNPVREALEQFARPAGLPVEPQLEVNSLPTTLASVCLGLGPAITLWLPLDWSALSPRLLFRPLIEPEVAIEVSTCRATQSAWSQAADETHALLIELVAERISAGDWPGATPIP
jgi:LysR family nitrogen assimilation transcriptional regulator